MCRTFLGQAKQDYYKDAFTILSGIIKESYVNKKLYFQKTTNKGNNFSYS